MKNLKKLVTLFLATFLISSKTFAVKTSLSSKIELSDELLENTQHNQQIIKQLPTEIWTNIFSFFPPQDRSHFAQICKDFDYLERTTPVSLRLTYAHLARFDSLLKYLSNHNTVEFFFEEPFIFEKTYVTFTEMLKRNRSRTHINDNQLAGILNQISANLKTLKLTRCKFLYNFEAIRNCTQLQELTLSEIGIDDEQLANILRQIGRNLRALDLSGTNIKDIEYCENPDDFEAIKNCTQLQELNLSYTYINDEQLIYILNQIGKNLRELNLKDCEQLHNFEAIRNCTQLQELDLSGTKISDNQLADILNQIGGNLRTLSLLDCYIYLSNYEAIINWTQERNINLIL